MIHRNRLLLAASLAVSVIAAERVLRATEPETPVSESNALLNRHVLR